ncbi:histidine kinase [Mucilaginibacter sp. PPCGB 2223]|uniref:FIST signal transduction protein n=1 Tax=Mucilaginibacter sp. PPCGB 2223 TaxID=1886027 RepID=UPI0008254622|nr:FIST N-terminal domain-containing protein [Mucilaginibacter sp. PPCGB 2223]OCX52557.1 histidine kinase [Mucilaginibacter sp. PPCGB 2223]
MRTALYQYQDGQWQTHPQRSAVDEGKTDLVLCFGGRDTLTGLPVYDLLRKKFPEAVIAICSTAGEIYHTEVSDNGFTATAIEFADTVIKPQQVYIKDYENSFDAGKALINQFDQKDLSYVLVLSDGSGVNGSELVRGINSITNEKILVTGGLAGDGARFEATVVGLNGEPEQGLIAGIGFYGKKLKIGHGSKGGWEMFGLERLVTKSEANVLYEMDDKNALDLYKRYLGPDADGLPGTALLYPLAVTLSGNTEPIVRTILSVDHEAGSMTFAGDIPKGAKVRFMRANFDKLTAAASLAATETQPASESAPDFALLISCVGRKMILGSRTEDEVDAVDEIFGRKTLLSGFYSYGEISPLIRGKGCQLHNQTMTITTFNERE